MNIDPRFLSLYTFVGTIAFYALDKNIPGVWVALVWLVGILATVLWLITPKLQFYKHVLGPHVTVYTIIIVDIIVHYLPMVIVGTPSPPDFIYSAVIVLLWYTMFRKDIPKMYMFIR